MSPPCIPGHDTPTNPENVHVARFMMENQQAQDSALVNTSLLLLDNMCDPFSWEQWLGDDYSVQNQQSSVSEEASPTSDRNVGVLQGGYSEEFVLSNAAPVDGTNLGARSKEEKNDPTPPWSELKTKAGKERKRLPLACIACRRRKMQCSGGKPACKHCLRSRKPCVYKVTTRKPAPRMDYMTMLDKRLKKMEERIIKIVPKQQQSAIPIVRADVKPGRNNADKAFDLDNWAKLAPTSNTDNSSVPVSLVAQETKESELLTEGADKLPSRDIQEHLSEVFFENVYGQTYHLLHKPSFMRKLKAGTLPPVLILAVCAISARFSSHPKIRGTPEFLRGEEWASEARNIVRKLYEWPNMTILTCLLILELHEFGICQGDRSWTFSGLAIRMAFALQLHKDLDHDPLKPNDCTPLSFTDREIRRRTMWACFLMDRLNSSGTNRPMLINQDQIKIPLPIKERCFQLGIPGSTENLSGEVLQTISHAAGELSNPRENMGVAAYMIRAIALWGRIINYLNLGGKKDDAHPVWHPNSRYTALMKQTQDFSLTLPDSLKYSRENFHLHESDSLANQFLFLHISIEQNILFINRFAAYEHTSGQILEDTPKDFMTKAGEKAFKAANRISELLREFKSCFVTAPFTGYCAFLSSTVHVFGVFSGNAAIEETSKENLKTNIKYLSKMKKYWPIFYYMSEKLQDQYRMHAGASSQGSATIKQIQIFQYGDWFNLYRHGTLQTEFEDPAATVKVEKGEDAVLEHKSDYHTVGEFFNSLSPRARQAMKAPKTQESSTQQQYQFGPVNTDTLGMTVVPPIKIPNTEQIPRNYNQMNPPTPVSIYNQPYFGHNMFLPAQQQGILPQLDRQLVFGAYDSLDPSQSCLDGANAWDISMGGMAGFVPEPSSAWMIPFNMEPPEMGQETDPLSGLRAANASLQKNMAKKAVSVGKGGDLTGEEVLGGQNRAIIHKEVGIRVVEPPIPSVLVRAPRKCSVCGSLEHNSRTCPKRQ